MQQAANEQQNLEDFWLVVVYLCFSLLSIFGAGLCGLLTVLLKKYNVFHANFREILANVILALGINNVLQFGRVVLVLYEWYYEKPIIQIKNFSNECLEFSIIPTFICAIITISGIILATERLYATLNFAKYEYEDITWILKKFFALMWTFMGFTIIWHICEFLAKDSNGSYYSCMLVQIVQNPLKSSWHIVITGLCQLVFLVVFLTVYKVNKEKQIVYIKYHYNNLSSRFQLGENIKATRLLLPKTFLLLITLVISFGHTYKLNQWFKLSRNPYEIDVIHNIILWQEISLLFFPLYSVIMPLIFILKCTVFMNRTRCLFKEMVYKVKGNNGRQKKPSGIKEAFFDDLDACWEDAMHYS
uniref:Uncharacterized protein n=1 Tax=Acrobeloides nanus TaxID=290746 RepID=A0A914DJ09_9BILA